LVDKEKVKVSSGCTKCAFVDIRKRSLGWTEEESSVAFENECIVKLAEL